MLPNGTSALLGHLPSLSQACSSTTKTSPWQIQVLKKPATLQAPARAHDAESPRG